MPTIYPPTIVLRHRKENLKKCSLSGLEGRSDFKFFTYPTQSLPPLTGYVRLSPEGPCLTPEDTECGLLLIDATWRYAEVMTRQVSTTIPTRSLPYIPTAYPRRQDQEGGLASIEALYLAYHLLGRDTDGLLDNYHWAEKFLSGMLTRPC